MSDINLDFTVNNNSINFTVEPNEITITPTDVQLAVYSAGLGIPSGTTGELQYNNNGVLGGASGTSYANGNLTLQVANTKITGGDNHYYLQTDGTGNLTWSVGTGNISGNGTVGGANSQIQFNDGGANFGGNAGFTFNKVTGNVSIPGNIIGNVSANLITLLSSNIQLGANSYSGGAGTVRAIAIGSNASANGNSSISIGNTTRANGTNSIAIGIQATSAGLNGIAIGSGASSSNQETISIGFGAGAGADARRAVFIGHQAGNSGNSSISGEIGAVGIGAFSATRSSDGAVAVGYLAANTSQDFQAVAIGFSAGFKQANYAVALGSLAGYGNAGANTQGANSIAIGYQAGYNISHANTIILNGSGQILDSTQANSLFVKPIRNTPTANYIFYEPTTGEISYSTTPPGSGNAAGLPTQIQFNTANVLNASANLTFDTATNNLVVTGNIVGTLISATGNISGNIISGNILRGPYGNGTSNINIPSANGNIGFSANGRANLLLIRDTGIIVTDTDDFYVTKANSVIHTYYVQHVAKTVSQLGTPSIHEGARSYVTDATSTTFGINAIGGGSFKMPVWCDGTNWRIG